MSSDKARETELIKYAHLAQHFLILGDNIDRLSEEIYRLENTLAFIRVSGAPHSILNIADLRTMLDKLKHLYSKNEILDIEIRYMYDTIKLGYFYVDNDIVLVYRVPIAYPLTYNLYKLSLVPNKKHQILLPNSPFLAISGDDSEYMETECPKVEEWYLCERSYNYKPTQTPDCIQQLITKQELLPSCVQTSVFLTKAAVERLDDKHYTMSFPNQTKVKISCGQEQHRVLQGSYLAVIPHECYLNTPTFNIFNPNDRIKGYPLKIIEMPMNDYQDGATNRTATILNSVDLEKLHSINEKIFTQTPISIEHISDQTLYHTTIPLYIMLSAAMISAYLVYRRFLEKRNIHREAMKAAIPAAPSEEAHPHEIKVDHSNISATLSRCV
nr:ORF4 [Ectropis grisescens TED virus]